MPQQFKVPGLKDVLDEVSRLSAGTKEAAADFLTAAVNAEKLVAVFKNNTGLKSYIELQKKSEETQQKVAEAAQKYADRQEKLIEKVRLAEIKLDQDREKSFDKYTRLIEKQASDAEKAAERERLAQLKLQKDREKSVDNHTKQEEKAIALAAKKAKQDEYNASSLGRFNAKLLESTLASKQLGAAMALLESEGKKDTAEFRNLEKQFNESAQASARLNKQYREFSKAAGDNRALVGSYAEELGGFFTKLQRGASNFLGAFGVTLGAGALAAVFKGAFDTIKEFEQSVADLSAITGASGDDLEYLKNKAIDLGRETKGGAVAVTEAYKLIASAKPELLEDVKALNAVTEATLTLAKASGLELPDAATRLTDALNQFGADADQASFFVDALANGAKYGAAEIPQITDALLKFGAVARSSNIDIKQATAMVELLAENGLKGADAGTALRNVLLKISAPDATPKAAREFARLGISIKDLKDPSIDIQKKFEMLKPLMNDNAAAVRIFGLENIVAAKNIIEHTDRLDELTGKMGEIGTAEEQAAIRMNTLAGKMDRVSASYDSLVLSVNEGSGALSSVFSFFVDSAQSAINELIRFNTTWEQLYGKAKEIGQESGTKEFEKRFNETKNDQQNFINTDPKKGTVGVKGSGAQTDEDIVKDIKAVAESGIWDLNAKLAEVNEKLKKTPERSTLSKLIGLPSGDGLRREKEELERAVAEKEAIIKAAQERIAGLGKPVVTPKDKPAEVLGDTSDASLKKQQENARKSAQLAIDAMKAALDALIAGYDAAEHLQSENIAHVQAISDMKIKIADAEMQKSLIGIEKGSVDEQMIVQQNAEKTKKIEAEKQDALEKLRIDGKKLELQLYEATHQSLIDGTKTLTDILVDEENRRMREILEIKKEQMRSELKINKDTTDEILKQRAATGEELTANQVKYLTWLVGAEKSTNKQIEKNVTDLFNYKMALIEQEEEHNKDLFSFKSKSSRAERIFAIQQANITYKKEKELNDKRLEDTEEGSKDHEAAVKKAADLEKDFAKIKADLDKEAAETRKDNLQQGTEFARAIFGEESAIYKSFAIAQITMDTIEKASAAFQIASLLAADPLTAALAPNAYLQGTLIVAQGALQAAKVAGVQFFFKGTDNAPYTGKGIAHEFGPEIQTDAFGRIKSLGSGDGAQLIDITKGDKIIPADVTASIKQHTPGLKVGDKLPTGIDYTKMDRMYTAQTNRLIKAVRASRGDVNVNVHPDLKHDMLTKKRRL